MTWCNVVGVFISYVTNIRLHSQVCTITTRQSMDGWIDERMKCWMNGWMDGCMNVWMDGWLDECLVGWMDELLDG